jgi:hypothetical protein
MKNRRFFSLNMQIGSEAEALGVGEIACNRLVSPST